MWKHATKPMEVLELELAEWLKELVIAAHTTYYGMDLYGEPRLVEFKALEKIDVSSDSVDVSVPDVLTDRL